MIRRLSLSLLACLAMASPGWAQTAYIAFGDSITEGNVGDDPARTELGYPPRLEALLTAASVDAVVENAGVGGETTAEGLARINSVLNELALSGDVLILMEGTNDISRSVSVETIRANLNEMARRATDRGLSVIHATTIPRLPNAKFDSQNVTNTRLNQNVRDMAGRNSRKVTDLFEILGTTADLFTRFYYQGTDDPVGHPNAAGYDLLAQAFFEVIRNVDRVPPVTGVMTPAHGDKEVSSVQQITVDVWDFGAGIDLTGTTLLVNGTTTGAAAVGDAKHATLTYQPPAPLSGTVSVALRSRDLSTTPNTVDREVSRFTIAGAQSLTGDMDQDGRVDGADLLRFARRFGARFGDTLYLASADFNEDGSIDGQDLAVLASNFGRSSS